MIDEKEDVSPDTLMGDFRGRGLIPIVILTVVVHLVVFGGTSVGYLKNELMGPATDDMSQEEKVTEAVKEATVAIRDIAEKYGISAQDVSDRFSEGGSRASKIAATGEGDNGAPAAGGSTPPDAGGEPKQGEDGKPKSDYEKTLETVAPPPDAPDLAAPISEEEDLF